MIAVLFLLYCEVDGSIALHTSCFIISVSFVHLWIGKCMYDVLTVYGAALNFVLLFNDYFVVTPELRLVLME